MANAPATPELNRDDVAILLKALRDSGRPMTTPELVAALREAAASR